MLRNVIIHLHILKNAGTTVDWSLKKNFGKQFETYDDKNPSSVMDWERIINFLKKHPNIKSLSSHQIRPPLPQNKEFHLIPLIFIRHPLDRVSSIYNWYRRIPSENHEFNIKAKTLGIKEFVKWYLDTKINMLMLNFQTIFLSSRNHFITANSQNLKIAFRTLENFPIPGLVERLDESLVLAEHVISHHMEKADLSYVRTNINPERAENLNKRLNILKENLGDELYNTLYEENKLDLELLKFIETNLDNKIARIPNFKNKLLNFRKRCQDLQKNQTKMSSQIKK